MPLLVLAAVSAGLNWAAVEKNWLTLKYITKPLTMLILILWLVLNGGLSGPALWFTLGALFSLLGDVVLMIPRNLFIFGLFAFLVGHVFYIIGFNTRPVELSVVGWLYLLAAAAALGLGVWQLYSRLAADARVKRMGNLALPVLIYALVISLMVLSALLCPFRTGWELMPSLWGIAGALLFFLSDTLLAIRTFYRPFPHRHLLVMLTYHLGQLGILLSASLTFLR